MKQFVTIDTDRELVEIEFTGNFNNIVMSPNRMEQVLRKYMKEEAEKLNEKLAKPKFGIVNEDDLKDE